MSWSRRRFLLRSAQLAAWPLAAPLAARLPAPDPLAAELAGLVPGLLARYAVPGLSLAVVDGGRVRSALGFGRTRLGDGEAVTADTVFQAASLSKPVFAYGVMKLWQEGRLDLDRPLVEALANPYVPYLIQVRPDRPGLMASPDLPDDPRLARITPRMVLGHATGLPNWSFGKKLEFRFDPGTGFGYSGQAHIYLQRVVEHLTGQPLAEYLEAAVLGPLGMASSSYVWRPDYDRRAAVGHDRSGEVFAFPRPSRGLAAGTLHTTARDFARFLLALLEPEAANLLRPETVRLMLQPQTEVGPALAWGLGLGLERTAAATRFWQWGDDGVFRHLMFGSPAEGRAVVAFTNSMNGLLAYREVIQRVLPGEHPALAFKLLDY